MATDLATSRAGERPVRRVEPPPWGAVPRQASIWPTPLQTDLLRATLLQDERGLDAWRRIRPLLDIAAMDYGTHAMLPRLRANLIALGIEDDPLLQLFKGVQRFTWARTQILLAQVMPIVADLERRGVRTMLLKGAAMLVDGRRHAGMRHMGDVDVLVPAEAIATAVEVILGHGLLPIEPLPAWYLRDYVPRVRGSVGFTDGAEGRIDLHWYVTRASCQDGADDDFWEASVPVELQGVRSRALSPADELLMLIVHGLRWAPTPGYRWVLDAALVVRDADGQLDYERLAFQARRRRVAPAIRSALAFLHEVADVEVPPATMRGLRVAAPMVRFELHAGTKQPRQRGTVGRAAVVHGEYLRRRLPLGARATPIKHARLAAERLGIRRPSDLMRVRPGGLPGPGRPFTEVEAPLGTGTAGPPPTDWGASIDLGDLETVRAHCMYGLWFPQDWGSWIAGREARIAVGLTEPATTTLLLELAAGGLTEGQPVWVLLDGRRLANVRLGTDGAEPVFVALPEELVRGRTRLELVFRAPDAALPPRLGINDDLRPLGVFLQSLCVRPVTTGAAGDRFRLGRGSGDEPMLAGGWGEPAAGGRWTVGSTARILLRTETPVRQLEWIAEPLLPDGAPPLSVDVRANGTSLGTVRCDQTDPIARVPLKGLSAGTDLWLEWRIHHPRSPSDFSSSTDTRPLGLFFREIALL
jgi:hypothetical protein